ncbi:DUF6234 family protein [Streptomyces sp. NPDC046261]|uniref:DUF6234 family protein n=1 Tax=Streptomyces sp. NPDC046261 TaxID=3157200 RepID=UPI0033C04E3B
MTSSHHGGRNVSSPAGRRDANLHPVADVAVAIGLLAFDVLAACVVLLFALDATGFHFFDAAQNDGLSMVGPYTAVAVTGAAVLLSAWALFTVRAVIAGSGQILAGAVLVLLAGAGLHEEYKEAHPPRPEPGYSGPHTQCRSGGDNSECNGS